MAEDSTPGDRRIGALELEKEEIAWSQCLELTGS